MVKEPSSSDKGVYCGELVHNKKSEPRSRLIFGRGVIMAIRPIVIDRKPSAAHVLTISSSGITLSAKFIKDEGLEEKEAITFYRDDEDDYWLGFNLIETNNKPDSLALVFGKQSSSRNAKASEIINKSPILAKTQKLPNKNDRTFEILKDKKNDLWFIRLWPAFERAVRWEDRNQIPNEAMGIYRYTSKDGEIMYLGKGNIRNRANSPERQGWGVWLIEYSSMESSEDALRWESFYLEDYSNRYGVLPPLNRIKGHSDGQL
jgi:hypothetical protein